MLFWEAVNSLRRSKGPTSAPVAPTLSSPRFPFDHRCAGITKSGKRCRARIREGREYCLFHDPEVADVDRHRASAKGGRSRRRLTHIPDGYLRKLTDRATVAQAMDRLYREVRLGVVTPQMGTVLLDILSRILDSGLADLSNGGVPPSRRTKVDKIRPKLEKALTPAELEAWKQAVATAPAHFFRTSADQRAEAARRGETPAAVPQKRALPAAS